MAVLHKNRLAVTTVAPLDIIGQDVQDTKIMPNARNHIIWCFWFFIFFLFFYFFFFLSDLYWLLLFLGCLFNSLLSFLDFRRFWVLCITIVFIGLCTLENIILLHSAVEGVEFSLIR